MRATGVTPLFMDAALARRVERAEAAISAAFVDARAAAHPHDAPERPARIEHAGAWAMFGGVDAPTTQSFGFGLHTRPTLADLEVLEAFFAAHGASAVHEVAPLAGVEAYALLAARGYRPIELTTVLVRALDEPLPDTPSARMVERDEADAWIDASVEGWGASPEVAAHVRTMARLGFDIPALASFVVEMDGQFVATGALGVHEGVALLAGASTVPAYRGRGAQRALFAARLAEAQKRGCTLATMGAEPGSGSQRNAERSGFRVAYTRQKWRA